MGRAKTGDSAASVQLILSSGETGLGNHAGGLPSGNACLPLGARNVKEN